MGNFMEQVHKGRKKNTPDRKAVFLSGALVSVPLFHFRVWVTVWVRNFCQPTKQLFATKNPQKPKFSGIFGAATQIRTGDLILTKDALYRLSYSSKCVPKWELFGTGQAWNFPGPGQSPGGLSKQPSGWNI